MKADIATLTKENTELKNKVAFLSQYTDSLNSNIEALNNHVELLTTTVLELREENRILKARVFGRRSEKVKEDALGQMLFDEADLAQRADQNVEPVQETIEVHIPEQTYTRKKRGRKPIDTAVPRVAIEYTMNSEQQEAFADYTITELGTEKSERLHEIPAQYYVLERIVHKYKAELRNDDGSSDVQFFSATIPKEFLSGSIATSGLLSHVITGKFCDGLPFNRQEAIFARHGITVSRQTMANWSIEAAKRLEPLMKLLEAKLLASPAINCDETPFVVMQEPGKANATKSYMVVLAGGGTDPQRPRIVLYRYSPHRSAACIDKILEHYEGALQSDAYKGYTNFSVKQQTLHAGCWAHARRRFHEAWVAAGKQGRAGEMLVHIKKLYDVESALREKHRCKDDPDWDTQGFLEERKTLIAPLFDSIHAWLVAAEYAVPPKSSLGDAVQYTLHEWERLIGYIETPWFTPDNNVVERAIRPFTVGRKNWVISGSPRGAYASAELYTLVETAKANDIDPYYYLRYVFDTLPYTEDSNLEALLPWNLDLGAIAERYAKEDAAISIKAKQTTP